MACCGQKRQALIQSSTVARSGSVPVQMQVQTAPPRTPDRSTSFAEPRLAPPATAPRPALGATFGVPFGAVALRYLARSPIVVRGPVSGFEYRFSAAQPVQRVARADREALLRTGHFSPHD